MATSRDDGLSTDELRKRLFQTFKDKGVLDLLKVQLRNHLIQELRHPPVAGQEPVPKLIPSRSDPHLVSTCNSIVADHLRISGYEYTLSVFYPETGLCKNTDVGTKEFMQLLNINPGTTLHSLLSSNVEDSNKGFLLNLVTQLLHHDAHSQRQDAFSQTNSSPGYTESLVEKMKMIDKEYDNFVFKDKVSSFESQMAEYRKEAKVQMEAEMNLKMAHFKDVEIAKVRMEEKSAFNKEFEKLKQELEKTYELKAKALMDREKNAIERLQKQKEIEEKSIYTQRQSVLKEIETLRIRDTELKMRMETFEKTCQIHGNEVKAKEELLSRREVSVKTMEDTYDQRLQNELSRYQLELKEDFMKRTENLKESEAQNKVESARIQKEAAEIDAKLEDHRRVCSELKRLQAELDAGQQKISLLTQEKMQLMERLEAMSDFSDMKIEKALLQGQLQLLRKQLGEFQEENQFRRSVPSKEQLVLQMEIQRLQSTHKLEKEEFDNQRQVLQTQLQTEFERNSQLKAQLMESEEKSQFLANNVKDMKMQLQQTQKALENEVLCNPKASVFDRSVLELTANKLVPSDIYVARDLLAAAADHDDVFQAGVHCQERKSPWSDFSDSNMNLIAEAKGRWEELQQEAQILEEAYVNYQKRAVHSTISHTLPSRALSPQQARVSHYPNTFLRTQDPHHHLYPQQANKPNVSQRPLSPHTIRSPSVASRGTRTTFLPAQARVTFSEENNQQDVTPFSEYGLHPVGGLIRREELPESSSSFKHGPSSLPSSSDMFHKETVGEAVGSPVTIPGPSLFKQLSPDPHCEVLTSGDFSPELSPPRSPQLRSTARDQSSPVKLQSVISSSESSPRPEKITLEDLTGLLSEPSHIPELLLDTAVPLSEEAPGGPTAPHPQDLPEDPVHLQGQTEGPQISDEPEGVQLDVERWENERIERAERRQREQEEARDRELQELERLEKEMLLQEVEQPAGETEEEKLDEKRAGEEQTKETVVEKEECKTVDAVEIYMKLLLEERDKQSVQNPGRGDAHSISPEVRSLSEEKDNSIAAYSHKGEDEDDFW